MELVQTLVFAGMALLGVAGAALVATYSGRRAAETSMFVLRQEFGALATSTANLNAGTREYMDRAYQHAQRASAHNATTRQREEKREATPAMTEADYMAHLTNGGAVIPEVEAALGLIT